MARIELTNVTAGGGGGSTTLGLTTTGTSGAALLSPISGGYILNIPVYQGALTLTTTGSGAATLSGTTLNIPTPTSSTAAGSTGEVQYNGGSGAFAASPNLFWAAGTNRLGIGTSSPNQTLEVSGAMRLTGTAGTADFMLGRSSAGDVSTVTLGTTGTSGAATLSANVLNIPQYQGAVSLTTTGTSGASTFAANVLNIPQYQGALTLTTTGTSGAATLSGTTLNIPQYSGGGGGTPAGNAGEVQFNSTPAGSFAASTAFVFDTSGPYLKVGASAPSATVGVNGAGTLAGTTSLHVRNSSSVDLLKVNDNGQFLLGENGAALTTNRSASIEVSSTNTNVGIAIVPKGTGAITAAIPDGLTTGGNARGTNAVDLQRTRSANTQVASGINSVVLGGERNTSSASYSISGGYQSLASGSMSIAIGGWAASGTQTASGDFSTCVGGYQSSASANNASIFGGNQNTASGTSSHIFGSISSSATSTSSGIFGGQSNSSTALCGLVLGGSSNLSGASFSTVINGVGGNSYLSYQRASANGRFAASGTPGDSQTSDVRVRRSITGTGVSELTIDGAAPAATNRLILALPTNATNGRLWNAIVQLSAICTTAGGTVTVGDSFIGTYNLGIKRIVNATSLVGTVQNMITAQADANMTSSVVTITADDTNESLKIEFTPPTGANASTVIRVVATVYLTEVGY